MDIVTVKKFGTIGVPPYFCSHPDFLGYNATDLPDSIRVVQLFLVQFVLVRIQVGQRKGKMKVFPFFYFYSILITFIPLRFSILPLVYKLKLYN